MRQALDEISKAMQGMTEQLAAGATIMTKLDQRVTRSEDHLHGTNGGYGLLERVRHHDNLQRRWSGIFVGVMGMWGLVLSMMLWIGFDRDKTLQQTLAIGVQNQQTLAVHSAELSRQSKTEVETLRNLFDSIVLTLTESKANRELHDNQKQPARKK